MEPHQSADTCTLYAYRGQMDLYRHEVDPLPEPWVTVVNIPGAI